ncbi:hypothetical protein GJ496_007532 [Pomphorhynchus laevis]|nr:hypothetical protein GJ496_000625 [Pomphorhynchus laevis]KAI0990367.1 hypothetical protein GJ496_007532 [Pomphorhynchus laevis]
MTSQHCENFNSLDKRILYSLKDFQLLARNCALLPPIGLISCIVYSLVYGFLEVNQTHCTNVTNVLPSLSAAISFDSNCKQIWFITISLHGILRLFVTTQTRTLWKRSYQFYLNIIDTCLLQILSVYTQGSVHIILFCLLASLDHFSFTVGTIIDVHPFCTAYSHFLNIL